MYQPDCSRHRRTQWPVSPLVALIFTLQTVHTFHGPSDLVSVCKECETFSRSCFKETRCIREMTSRRFASPKVHLRFFAARVHILSLTDAINVWIWNIKLNQVPISMTLSWKALVHAAFCSIKCVCGNNQQEEGNQVCESFSLHCISLLSFFFFLLLSSSVSDRYQSWDYKGKKGVLDLIVYSFPYPGPD